MMPPKQICLRFAIDPLAGLIKATGTKKFSIVPPDVSRLYALAKQIRIFNTFSTVILNLL